MRLYRMDIWGWEHTCGGEWAKGNIAVVYYPNTGNEPDGEYVIWKNIRTPEEEKLEVHDANFCTLKFVMDRADKYVKEELP